MTDLIPNFIFGVVIIGVPCYIFYRLGMDNGIKRGVRRQVLRTLMKNRVIDEATPEKYKQTTAASWSIKGSGSKLQMRTEPHL